MNIEKIKIKPGSVVILSVQFCKTKEEYNNFDGIANKILSGVEEALDCNVILDNNSIQKITILEPDDESKKTI